MIGQFLRDERGATAIEYGLFAAMMGVMMIASFMALKGEYHTMFGAIETAVTGANSP